MRILLTGAAGFIGSTLAERLVGRGDEVLGLDCFDETLYPAAVKRRQVAALEGGPAFRLITGDFLDPAVLERLARERLDAVIHLGALAGVRLSLEQPRRYQRVNVEGTAHLLRLARDGGVRRFLFASSSSVYDPLTRGVERPLREDDPAQHPASPYGETKRDGELLCARWSADEGLNTTCLRLFSVYGPRQRPDMAIHKFTRLLLEERPVPLFGDGASMRDYTYVDDVVDGLVAALDRCGLGPERHRVYNLGAGRTTTLGRLVQLLSEQLGVTPRFERLPEQAGDAFATWADISRAAAELGYAPQVSVEEGIARFIRWVREAAGSADATGKIPAGRQTRSG